MRLVLDASVALAWCFVDECDEYADAVLGALSTGTAVAPSVWPLAAANVLLAAERRRRLTPAASTRFLELLANLGIEVDPCPVARTWGASLDQGRTLGISAYDASYLDLAMRSGLPLATRDEPLRAACDKVGVRLFSAPSASGAAGR